jgi:hypothetical protein
MQTRLLDDGLSGDQVASIYLIRGSPPIGGGDPTKPPAGVLGRFTQAAEPPKYLSPEAFLPEFDASSGQQEFGIFQ